MRRETWGEEAKPREVKRLTPGHTAHSDVCKGCRWRPNPGTWPLACRTQTFPDACSLHWGVTGRAAAFMVVILTAHMSACFLHL